jgi:hypothetical protein
MDAVVDAVGGLLPPLLGALERVEWVQRHLYPPLAGRLADALAPQAKALADPLHALETVACPAEARFLRDGSSRWGGRASTSWARSSRRPARPGT